MLLILAALALVIAACDTDDNGDDASVDDTDNGADDGADDDADDGAEGDSDAEAAEPQDGGTLRIAYPRPVVTLDQMSLTPEPHAPRRAVFEQLYGFDAALEPQPILATDHEVSDDGLTWTIGIQEGVQFHNGETMTADDVVASWERYEQVGARAWELDAVDTVTAVDDHTVELALSEPHGGLLESMSPLSGSWVIMPESVVDEIGADGDLSEEHYIGTGPYEYEDHEPEVQWVLTRFEDYWGGPEGEPSVMAGERNAYFERIEIQTIEDDATRVSALQGDEIDVAHEVPGDEAPQLEDDPDVHVQAIAPGLRNYWKFNPTIPPFDDDVLREAVRTGLDPESLMAGFGPEEYWRVNCTPRFQDPQWPWSDQCHTFPQDMEAAQQLVEESDYDGEEITMLVSPARAAEYPMVVPMEAYMAELGLNVTIESVDGATFGTIREDTDAWHIKHSGGGSFVGTTYLDSSGADRTGTDWPTTSPEWYETIEAAVVAETDEERYEYVQQVFDIHAEDNNELWVGDVFVIAAYRDGIQGVPEDDYSLNFLNMSRDQ